MRCLYEIASCAWQALRRLRRLPWAAHEPVLVRVLLASAKGRFTDLPLVASLAAGLSRYHPSLGIALPDALLEEVCTPCMHLSGICSTCLHSRCM